MTVWKYQNKKTGRETLYGNLRMLANHEVVMIKGKILKEFALRYHIKKASDNYEDNNVVIRKIRVIHGIQKQH